jgi:universal stress protein E
MISQQRLLVAIEDPFNRRQLALRKAAAYAARVHARVSLFHAFSLPYPLPEPEPTSGLDALRAASELRRTALERLARPLIKAGIKVDCAVQWDFPVYQAIVRQVLRCKPTMLIAESHRHGRVARWLLANTDWELIRACPCPLWFVKTPRLSNRLSVLAAIDPLHAHAKPTQLDDRIIQQASMLSGLLAGSVKLVHAYTAPLHNSAATIIEPLRPVIKSSRSRQVLTGVRKKIQQLADRHSIPAANCLIKQGDAVEVISDITASQKIDLLVMGAVSRSELQRSYIGSTAEKLIDRVRCDLLIVKPDKFKTSVPKQTAMARLRYSKI